MTNFETFGHFLTVLAMKKRIWPFCRFDTVKFSFHYFVFLYFLDGFHVTRCHSNM